jgi:hypothetical protein
MFWVKPQIKRGHASGKTQKDRKTVSVDVGSEIREKPVFPLLETIPEKTGAFYRVTWKNHYWFVQGESAQEVIDELAREGVTGIRIRKAMSYENPSV